MVSIAIRNLSVALGRRTVVRDVSAAFEPGELVGIVGPNGAGKSSLLRALLGLLPRESGDILVDGESVARIGRQTLARRIAYLPQGQTLHWPLTVERLVALGRLPHLAPMSSMSASDLQAIDRALVQADAEQLRARIATELSGGERARALLARMLAVEAPVLVADEPLAALDPGHQIDVMALLENQARQGKLVLTVLHDLTMAARYCSRLVMLDRGALVADGRPNEVLTPDILRAVYGIEARISHSKEGTLVVPIARC